MINGVTRRRTIGADAAIGVITTASFALGLALFALFGGVGRSFDAALFGSILGVSTSDVLLVAVVSVAAAALVLLRYRQLLFATFDPEVADASGVRTARHRRAADGRAGGGDPGDDAGPRRDADRRRRS